MASAAFREQDGLEPGDDMVSRLLSHSARARSHAATAARPVRGFGGPLAGPLAGRPAEAPAKTPDSDIEALLGTARLEDEIVRLEAELRVVQAALRAEQQEAAALRAELDQVRTYATPVVDIRSDRDRWATLVERLLFVER